MTWEKKTKCCFVRVWGCVLSLSALRVDWSMLRMIHLICRKLQDSYIKPPAFLKSKKNTTPPQKKKSTQNKEKHTKTWHDLLKIHRSGHNLQAKSYYKSCASISHHLGSLQWSDVVGLSWVLDASEGPCYMVVFDKQMLGNSHNWILKA